jgi:4-hydroxybenzoate polyprenyltransferase
VGVSAGLGMVYWIGLAGVTAILAWEHRLVTPGDLSRINKAFFDVNAYVSLGYFIATLADVLITAGGQR